MYFKKESLRKVFIDLIKLSREIDRKNPLDEQIRFAVKQHEIFGEIPLYKPSLFEYLKVLLVMVRWTLTKPKVEASYYTSLKEAHEEALQYFEYMPDPEHYEPDEHHLSDEWLHYMVRTKFSPWLSHFNDKSSMFNGKPLTGPAFALDLEFMHELPIKPGYERHGGKIIINDSSVLGIIHHGKTYSTSDADWELAKYKFRTCGFVWATLLHTIYHVRETAKFFTATHLFLPHTHPLNQFLLPYLYGVDRNTIRLQRTVIGNKGVVSTVGGFSSGPEALRFILNRSKIQLFPEREVVWPVFSQNMLEIWEIMYRHVSEFIDVFKLNAEKDQYIRQWLHYLGTHVGARLFSAQVSEQSDLSLADVITYLMFISTVQHYILGHIMNGSTDPRYVSGSVRLSDKKDLWSLTSTRDECLIREAVYASVNRHVYYMTDDFSNLCINPKAKAIVRNLRNEMKKMSVQAKEKNQNNPYPELLDPDLIPSSAAQ